jgi:hypothetical protein
MFKHTARHITRALKIANALNKAAGKQHVYWCGCRACLR